MKLQIVSRPKKTSLKLIRNATEFFAFHAISSRIKPNLIVTLYFDDELWKKYKNWGSCEPIYNEEWKPKEFDIKIDSSQSVKKIIRTIAHEIVHVNQYATGKLKDYLRVNRIRWDNWVFDYPNDECEEASEIDYYLSPWEIEAMGMEEGLYQLWRKHSKKLKI